jgi:hypothetical protein
MQKLLVVFYQRAIPAPQKHGFGRDNNPAMFPQCNHDLVSVENKFMMIKVENLYRSPKRNLAYQQSHHR